MRVLDDKDRLETIYEVMRYTGTNWDVMAEDDRRVSVRRLRKAFTWLLLTIELDGEKPSKHEYARVVQTMLTLQQRLGVRLQPK